MTPRSYPEMKRRHLEEGTDEKAFIEELQRAISEDPTGRGFIYEMFFHELTQKGYSLEGDLSQLLGPLGLSAAKVHCTPSLFNGLKMAMEDCVDDLEATQDETSSNQN